MFDIKMYNKALTSLTSMENVEYELDVLLLITHL